MTFEHKIVVSLDDIKAVTFECKECGTRTTIPTEKLQEAPSACGRCKTIWWSGNQAANQPWVTTAQLAIPAFIGGLFRIRTLIQEKQEPVRILLEFDQPHGT